MTASAMRLASRVRVWGTESGYRALGAVSPLQVWPLLTERLRNERLPANELEQLTWVRLRTVLRHCQERVPFYRDLWRRHGVDPTRFQSPADLGELPIVNRKELTAARRDGAFGRAGSRVRLLQTSGTTAGAPFAVLIGFDAYQKKYANHLRQFYTAGWRLGMRSAALHNAGHGQFRGRYSGERDRREPWHRWRELGFAMAHNRLLLTPYHSALTGDDAIVAEWLRRIRSFRPAVMDTFYMNALMLADLVDRGGHEPVAIPALFILGTLEGAARKRLERIFGGEVFNRYSPHECEGIAVACSQHEGMHVAVDSYVVEITGDDGAPLAPEEVGHVVVTDLENMTMPLIRYAIGDLARWITAPCPCGRVFPRMSDLHGRQRDVLGTFRGHPVPPWAAERVLQGHPKIRFFQIVRTADGITISVVLAEGAPLPAAEIADLERRIEQLFAPPLPVRMVPVDRVPFEPNGKYRFVKNVMEDQDAI